MTKQELSQLCYLKREVVFLKERIKELECAAKYTSVEITGIPVTLSFSDRVGNCATEIVELKELLEVNLKKCFCELNRLIRFIENIEDSKMRMILSLRYINGMTWQQVAFSIGEYDEQYPRKKHDRFLRDKL